MLIVSSYRENQSFVVDGVSRKNAAENVGRTDTNKKVVFDAALEIPSLLDDSIAPPQIGDWVEILVTSTVGITLRGTPLRRSTRLSSFLANPL